MSAEAVHPAGLPEAELLARTRVERTRASGPGGQHRNRVATAIRLTWLPTGLQVSASERRSQRENLKKAVFRLRLKLALDIRSPLPESLGPPSPCWRQRVRNGRIRVNPQHPDFPGLLAEALDRLEWCEDDPTRAAADLGISCSQLVKFLGILPEALARLNERRKMSGLKKLR